MPRRTRVAATARATLFALTLLILGYLGLLAAQPQLRTNVPAALQWFGRPGSWQTLAVVTVLLVCVAAVITRSYGVRRTGTPVAIVAGLALIATALGFVSYWRCYDQMHPPFFTALMWTAGVVKGGTGDQSLAGQTCPSPTPIALEVARLSALAAIFLSVIGVAVALFQSRWDRLRVFFAKSVTAVVDVDEEAASMVSAVARTLPVRSTLVVVTESPDRPSVREARIRGAKVVTVDFARPETLTGLPLWHKLDKLYLLAADPSANLKRLRTITDGLPDTVDRQRIPLVVRIDDPWQAAAWRAEHFGGTTTRWAADAVGKYEVTARRLLEAVTADTRVERILVCGTSRLTLALCADVAQRRIEREYYTRPDESPLPDLILVAANADEAKDDYEFACTQRGLPPDHAPVQAIGKQPSVPLVLSLLAGSDPATTAVILVDSPAIEVGTGTRLAARTPKTPIWAWDPDAETADDSIPLVGQLRTYRLSMDVVGGQAQDAWERAARLIHDRYAATVEKPTPATRPWDQLDEFYRGSNRRQVQNALWMVEKIGGHTWNTWGSPPDPLPAMALRGLAPLEQLRRMGFDRRAALAMARAEHEDWCRYYRDAGWKYAPVRDDACKLHTGLVDWADIEASPELLDKALASLATTLLQLRELGYRSRPLDDGEWLTMRRTGIVIADQRDQPWTWTTRSGETMHADAGDWAVRDPDSGESWSVRDDVFRARHEHLQGQRWRRTGTVQARRARDGEIVDTLEGSVTAAAGDWLVRGADGELWPVPDDEFARRYEPLAC